MISIIPTEVSEVVTSMGAYLLRIVSDDGRRPAPAVRVKRVDGPLEGARARGHAGGAKLAIDKLPIRGSIRHIIDNKRLILPVHDLPHLARLQPLEDDHQLRGLRGAALGEQRRLGPAIRVEVRDGVVRAGEARELGGGREGGVDAEALLEDQPGELALELWGRGLPGRGLGSQEVHVGFRTGGGEAAQGGGDGYREPHGDGFVGCVLA